jgi:nucleoside-diphosphate-sugar epimerase
MPVVQRGQQKPKCCQEEILVTDLADVPAIDRVFASTDAIIHLAARAHIMQERAADPLSAFRKTNVDGTVALARAAATAGVRRFVFVSSVGVNGAARLTGCTRYSEEDQPAPHDPYSRSKWEAEQALIEIAATTPMQVVRVRPPLVYGPSVPGNMLKLLHLIARGVPIPAIRNLRSFIGRANLVDFLTICLEHPAAGNELFLVSDGHDLSTEQLVRALCAGMGRSPRLFPFPLIAARIGARVPGKQEFFARVFGSLIIDSQKARRVLGWSAPVRVEDGLRCTAEWYRKTWLQETHDHRPLHTHAKDFL